MSFYVGDTAIAGVYVGDTAASKIYIGDTLAWPNGLTFSDDFNRSDSTNLGANWTEYATAVNGLDITSNELRCFGSGSFGWARWNTTCATDNQFCECTLGSIVNGEVVCGVRLDQTDGYPCAGGWINAAGNWQIRTYNSSGTSTNQASGFTFVAGVTGDVIRFEAVGNVYTLKRNGSTLGSWTDSGGILTPGSGQRGVGVGLARGAGSITVNSWTGGDL